MTWLKWVTPEKFSYLYKSTLLKLFALYLSWTAKALVKSCFLGKQKFILFPRLLMGLVGAGEGPPVGFVLFWEPAPCGRGWMEEEWGAVCRGLGMRLAEGLFMFLNTSCSVTPALGSLEQVSPSVEMASFGWGGAPSWEPWRPAGIKDIAWESLYRKGLTAFVNRCLTSVRNGMLSQSQTCVVFFP